MRGFSLASMEGVALIGIATAAIYVIYQIAKAGGEKTGAAAGKFIADAAGGVVIGIGDSIGVPRTDETKCQAALREGRTWDASKYCTAGAFVKSWFSKKPSGGSVDAVLAGTSGDAPPNW